MSTLIYCKNGIAASPFYIEEASLNVYSLEELSYFLLNNVYLLSNKFMSVDLCNWISRDLKQKDLGNELLNLVNTNAPLHIFVGHILSSNGYSSKKEIKELLDIISTFENKSEAECKKLRADRLIESAKYVDAIYEYELLLSQEIVNTIPKKIQGDIYHNLGVAFAKLFFFNEAKECFEEAYKRNQNPQSLRSILFSCKCNRDKNKFNEIVEKYHVTKEEINDILNIVDNEVNSDVILKFDKRINDLVEMEESSELFNFAHSSIENWKTDYSKCCRI